MAKQVITLVKLAPERARLSEVSVVVLQQAVTDLNACFASITGNAEGRKIAPPRPRTQLTTTRPSARPHAGTTFS